MDGVELLDSRPGHFTHTEHPRSPLKKASWLSERVKIFWKGKIYLASSGNRKTIPWFSASSLVIYLYQGCGTKNDVREDFFWHMAFASVIFFISFHRPTPVYCEEYVHIYRHISDCVETVYELPLLPNYTASETFYTNRERCDVLTG